MKNSTDLTPITLLMSYLLIFWVLIILLILGAALEQETDALYYEKTEGISNELQ